MKLYHSVLYKK